MTNYFTSGSSSTKFYEFFVVLLVKNNTRLKNKLNTYLFIITSFQDRDIDLSTSEFRMTMKTERWMNDERFVNDRWTNGERTLNALWTVNASERWTLNAKLWTMNARWAHAERTVNGRWANGERTQKWESRTFQGLYMKQWFYCWLDTVELSLCLGDQWS